VGDEIPPAFSEFAAGSLIAGYRLEERIGRGGMAVVYRAHDSRLDRHVALKILAPVLALDDAFRHRFIRESRAAAAVDHPNIIPVFDAGEAGGVLYIAMRFVQGRDVRTLLDRTGPLPVARASGIISQVASALDAAHARGLVHRDVKPANMLLDDTSGADRQDHVYLSDFGLSKHALSQTGITSQGQVLGTLDYIAPEQIEGRPVDGRADLYALACATFELLSGRPPFKRDGGLAVVWAQLSEPPPPLSARRSDLPSEIDGVLAKAMAKSPAERFPRCTDFAQALREALGLGPGASGVKPIPPPSTQLAAALPTEPPRRDAAPAGGGRPPGPDAPEEITPWSGRASWFRDAVPPADAGSPPSAARPVDPAPARDAFPAADAGRPGDPWPSRKAAPAPGLGRPGDAAARDASPAVDAGRPGDAWPSREAAPAPRVGRAGDAAADEGARAPEVGWAGDATARQGAPLPEVGGAGDGGAAREGVAGLGVGRADDAGPPPEGVSTVEGAPPRAAGRARHDPLWAGARGDGGAGPARAGPAAGDDAPGGASPSGASHKAEPFSGRPYEAGLYAGRPHAPEPPTETAGLPPPRSTRPGLTEPGSPPGPRASGLPGGGPRPPWWRSRGALSAAAGIVVLGIVAGAFIALHAGSSGNSMGSNLTSGLTMPLKPPGCTTKTGRAPLLAQVRQNKISLGGNPFGVVATPDGKYSFVSRGNSVAVLKNNGGPLAPAVVASIPAPGAKKSEAITPSGRYLLAAEGSGAYVINVNQAEVGGSGIMGTIASPGGVQSVEVSISRDGRFVFITLQDSGEMAVFDLQKSIAGGYGQSGFVGMVKLGTAPVGIAQSPNGDWLYVTSERANGRLYVISTHLAETDPAHAVKASAPAGCGPARVLVSADGRDIWVTDRDSNALVAFSAAKLLTKPSQSLIARVSVGQKPIGLTFVHGGKEIMVADSNLSSIPGADSLDLVSTEKALQGQEHALLGFIPAGRVPRELALEPGGKTLLSTDNNSGQLQAIDVGTLP